MEYTKEQLIDAACKVRKNAYAPYSHFAVGAAAVGDNGKIYTGCNVENISFGATLCAERVAFGAAVADGCRRILAVAVVGGMESDPLSPCFPCGICLQVMGELCAPDAPVFLTGADGKIFSKTVKELLPHAFAGEGIG